MSAVTDVLLTLADRGELTPPAVVDAARPEESPLHSCFEWDDGRAAEQYRLVQAGTLIRRVRVTVITGDTTNRVREFVHVPGDGYRRQEAVAADPVARDLALATMAREWRAFRNRWRAYDELWRVVAADMPDHLGATG